MHFLLLFGFYSHGNFLNSSKFGSNCKDVKRRRRRRKRNWLLYCDTTSVTYCTFWCDIESNLRVLWHGGTEPMKIPKKIDVTLIRRSSSQLDFMPGEEIPLMYDSKPLSHAVLCMKYYWILSGSWVAPAVRSPCYWLALLQDQEVFRPSLGATGYQEFFYGDIATGAWSWYDLHIVPEVKNEWSSTSNVLSACVLYTGTNWPLCWSVLRVSW